MGTRAVSPEVIEQSKSEKSAFCYRTTSAFLTVRRISSKRNILDSKYKYLLINIKIPCYYQIIESKVIDFD